MAKSARLYLRGSQCCYYVLLLILFMPHHLPSPNACLWLSPTTGPPPPHAQNPTPTSPSLYKRYVAVLQVLKLKVFKNTKKVMMPRDSRGPFGFTRLNWPPT